MAGLNMPESGAPETQVLALLEKAYQNVLQAEMICDQVTRNKEIQWDVDKERDMQHIRTRLHNLSLQADEVRVLVRRCVTHEV